MAWAEKPHPAEIMVEWGAPMVPAAAAGWAASAAGLPLAAVVAAGMIALMTGMVAMRATGGALSAAELGFEPVAFEDVEADDKLLLDDPLTEIEPDSGVVQLFPDQNPTPGELISRISNYLADGRRGPSPVREVPENQSVDASAALHAALANIRASLR